MRSDKNLEWYPRRDSPDQLQAKTEFHGSFDCYEIVPASAGEEGWWVGGVGNQQRVATVEEGKHLCQDDYNRKRLLKAWEDYMLSHDPPAAT